MYRTTSVSALAFATILCSSVAAQGIITTVAGGGPKKISARSVALEPHGVAVDGAGNVLIAAEAGIFRVDPSGQLTTIGDGCGHAVCWALSVAVTNTGIIYAADLENNRVLRIDRNGASATVGGGDAGAHPPGALAWSVAVDSAGAVYIADAGAHRVRKVDANGVETTVAGTGTAGFSGDGGPATSAMLSFPSGVAVDAAGVLYIADLQNVRIRRVDKNGVISTVAGNGRPGFGGDGGPATRARLSTPHRVAVDRSGALYVADVGNHRIRKVDTRGTITTVAGNGRAGFRGDGGPATRASLDEPSDVAVSDQGTLYIADPNNSRVRAVAPNGVITTVAGGSDDEFTWDGGPATNALLNLGYLHSGIALDSAGALYITEEFGEVRKIHRTGIITSVAHVPDVRSFSGLAVDMAGAVYVASDARIRKIDAQGTITPVAGNGTFLARGDGGPATSAGMTISGITVDRTGALFVVDGGNNRVRRIDANGIITTVAGNGTAGSSGDGGPAASASVGNPVAVAVDGDGLLYIAQGGPVSRIRKVDRSGIISTVAGSGTTAGSSGDGGPATSASLNIPVAVAVDGSGNIYIAEMFSRVRKVDARGIITTVAGDGTEGFKGDGGPGIAARLNQPVGLAVTSDGTLFISDWGNQRIRMLVDRR